MTETDIENAREWYHKSFDQRWKWAGDLSLSIEDRIARSLAAYGAAQYEAGAAQMRERAAASAGAYIVGNRGWQRERDLCGYVAEIVRALPLREKEG